MSQRGKEKAVREAKIVHANWRDERKFEGKIGISYACVYVCANMHLSTGVGEVFNENPVIYCNACHTKNCHLLNTWQKNRRMVNVRNLKLLFFLSKYNSCRICSSKNGFIISPNILTRYLKGLCAFWLNITTGTIISQPI